MSMDGRYFARSQEGGAIMSMDGRAKSLELLCVALISYIHVTMHFPHFPLPCGSFSQGAREGGAIMSM